MPGKLQKFDEVNSFPNCFHLSYFQKDEGLTLRGKWGTEFFFNTHPIVLEVGCGRGEYTIGLAKKNPDKNFIGIDIKGARIWDGAKSAIKSELRNVAFIRTRIEFVEHCFTQNEIDEIWITFPDPQPQKSRERKRLTNFLFLKRYMKFLKPRGLIHLKTDNTGMYEYSLESMRSFGLSELFSTDDLYANPPQERLELLEIKTYYEKLFSEKGEKIKYCLFQHI